MSERREKMRALLATGRIANLPTVCSNVLVGFWLSSSLLYAHQWQTPGQDIRPIALLMLMLPCCMIYVAGCMLGDAVDYRFDLKNRPERPLPRGILSPHGIRHASYLLFGLALILLSFANHLLVLFQENNFSIPATARTSILQPQEILWGLLLTGLVMAYAFLHKRNKVAALTMMGSCRFLLVVLAILFAHKTYLSQTSDTSEGLGWIIHSGQSRIFVPAIAVAAYTVLLSWVASTESKPGAFHARKILSICLLIVPASSLSMVYLAPVATTAQFMVYALTMVLCYLWIFHGLKALKHSKPLFVSRALAGFCLLDATYLALIEPMAAALCLLLFVAALALQRATPAT